ncbi:MAG TPA: thioredoxin family protein [Dehalococcoidia bacterium]|nr:thioredoxin family protein [Dehalococcoidia bacterium]
MVQETHSVVTPERFAAGYTYADYLDNIERNRARFEENYAATTISDEDAAALRELAAKPNGPAKVLVIGEDWCPDVFRGLPVFQRIAEAAGIEMRIFKRDENKDVIAEFLNGGEFESIPVAVFYTKDHDYIAHWIERPQLAYEEMREKLAPMYARWRKPDPTDEERARFRQEYIDFQNGPIWANWRQETVREVIALLREKVG